MYRSKKITAHSGVCSTALYLCCSRLQSKELPPNAVVSCELVQSVSLLPGRHHLTSQASQPEAQWPLRKCARIRGCGPDKLATLEGKDRIKRKTERGRERQRGRREGGEREASFFFFWRCAVTPNDACWLHRRIKRVPARALHLPFRVTIIKPDDLTSSRRFCEHRSVSEQSADCLPVPVCPFWRWLWPLTLMGQNRQGFPAEVSRL